MLSLLLPFFILFFAVIFVWPSWRIWRRDGNNPFVLPRDDSAEAIIGVWMKVVMGSVLILSAALVIGIAPKHLGAIHWLTFPVTQTIGWGLLIVTLIWLIVAQAQMGKSWRIGIDSGTQTKLISGGLFRRSRNPIFLGLRLNMLGLFLIIPCAVSLSILIACEILIAIQVRLEEVHLRAMLGQPYVEYCSVVRRWI